MVTRFPAWMLAGAVLTVLTGCVVYVDSPPPRRVVYVDSPPPPPPPPPATEIVITEDDEVHYVVYREYFGCTDAEIYAYPHYRRYYAVTDDDIYFITFVARRRGITFDACFHSYYYDCGRNYDRLIVTYNVPRSTFFCSVGVGVTTYPPVYQRTYVAYQQGTVASLTIQNNEYVALVHMKVGVEYQGHPPAAYFAQVNAHGGNTGAVIVANRESCGKGGVTATGGRVTTTAPRPWTMPPAQKQAWHDQQKSQVVHHEDAFKDSHKEQVTRVQKQQKAPPGQARPAAQGSPGARSGRSEGNAGQKSPAGTQGEGPAQGTRHVPAETDARGQRQPPSNREAQPPPHKQVEGRQPPPREKGKNEEEEKKGK